MEQLTPDSDGPVVDEYKGNKILILNPGSKFPFSFGVTKAKLVIEHFEAIKSFVQQYDKKTS